MRQKPRRTPPQIALKKESNLPSFLSHLRFCYRFILKIVEYRSLIYEFRVSIIVLSMQTYLVDEIYTHFILCCYYS
ncbi:hypothetical protein ALTERO38_50771 [Alteromonas sp. 38]|nr:hypothetical protein ALTER154_80494 [Alteromonas sp. 154]VXB47727.1 hypothetical protein ALTERO38_50771 [Alteromonas sp. 38]